MFELNRAFHSPLARCQRAMSALPSPSKSNQTLPAGWDISAVEAAVAIGAEVAALEVTAKPKNEASDEVVEETRVEKGETDFARVNSAGSSGALKKPAIEEYAPDTEEPRVVTEERAVNESVFEDGKTNGSGGAATGAGATGAAEATAAAIDSAEVFCCQPPTKIIGVVRAVIISKTASRVFRLKPLIV